MTSIRPTRPKDDLRENPGVAQQAAKTGVSPCQTVFHTRTRFKPLPRL
jgi:hypothetical protein